MAPPSNTSAAGSQTVFNRTEVEDFLRLRWTAINSQSPQVLQGQTNSSAGGASGGGAKKSAWADAAKVSGASSPAPAHSTFAYNLIKAANANVASQK